MKKKRRKKSENIKWRDKADKLWTEDSKGKPCEICGSTQNTCGHHIVAKSLCAKLRHDLMNRIILCPEHHCFSREIAPHSLDFVAQDNFNWWLANYRSDQYDFCLTHRKDKGKIKYKEQYEQLKEQIEREKNVES